MQNQRLSKRWWLYLPRNLSQCDECEEELKKHIQRKTLLLEDCLQSYPQLIRSLAQCSISSLGLDENSTSRSTTDLELEKYRSSNKRRKSDSHTLKSCVKLSNRSKEGRKIVRFADSLGLELEKSRSILFSNLPPYINLNQVLGIKPGSVKLLATNFKLSSNNFCSDKARDVYLNCFNIYDDCLIGDVNVKNLNYHKVVFVRLSVDEWRSYKDHKCRWVSTSIDKTRDLFSFSIFIDVDTLQPGCKVEFAICYLTEGRKYWDNNGGSNYTVEVYERFQSPWDKLNFHPSDLSFY